MDNNCPHSSPRWSQEESADQHDPRYGGQTTRTPANHLHGNDGNDEADNEGSSTWIKVANIPDGVGEEELDLYFSNKRRHGGGEIKAIKFDPAKLVAFIEFVQAQAVERVLNKCPLLMRENRIRVERFLPEMKTTLPGHDDTEGCIVRVTGLAPNTDKELLTLYFENTKKSGGDDIDHLEFVSDGSVLITFADPQVAQRVLEKTDLVLLGAQLTASLWQNPAPQDSKTIKVTGLKTSTSEEILTLYFENTKKSGGGDIEELILRGDGTALVTFEEDDVAQRVISKGNLQLEGNTLEVYLCQKSVVDRNTVHVSGIAPNTVTELVTLFFESERKSGGGDIEKIVINRDGTAVITFQNIEVAQRVLDKDDLMLGGKPLTVSPWLPHMEADQQTCQQSAPRPVINSIQVSRLTDKISKDSLFYYFENERRSHGGDIEHINLDEEKLVAFITFQDPKVVSRVLEKRDHKVENVHLHVEEYIPPPPIPSDPCKVFIEGVKPETTEECLRFYMESRCELEPQTIITGEKPGTRMVIFDQPVDVNSLSSKCKQKSLEDSFLAVSCVPVSNCIRVTNFTPTTTQDTILFYFESKKRSGGGTTADCVMFKEEGYCIVYFEDFTVINEVIDRKHSLGGQKLDVCVHYDCLGLVSIDGTEMPVVIPEPVAMSDINLYLLDFILQSPSSQQYFNSEIQQQNGKPEWPAKRGDSLKIHCSLTKDMKHIRRLIPGWNDSIMAGLKSALQMFLVREITCLQETWSDIKAVLQEYRTMDPKERGMLVMEDSQYKVVIVGPRVWVQNCQKMVEKRKQSLEDELDRQKKILEEKTTLKHYQIRYLGVLKFLDSMKTKYQQLGVALNYEQNEVIFSGLPKEITNAQLAMYDEINRAKSNKMTVSPSIRELMLRSPTIKYLSGKLERNSTRAVWDIQDSEVNVFAPTDKDIVDGTHTIKNSLAESVVPVKADSIPFISSPIWHNKVQELEELNAGILKIIPSSDNTKIIIVAIDDIMKNILEILNDFLKANTIMTEFSQLDLGTAEFVEKFKLNELKSLEKSLQAFKVEIQIDVTGEKPGIAVKGTEDGVHQVKLKLEALTAAVKSRRYHINKPGIPKYLRSPKGRDFSSTVEQKFACIIREDSKQYSMNGAKDFFIADNTNRTPQIRASVNLSQNRKILAVVGDITEYRIDVIVNAANGNLCHGGGLARVIVEKGGKSIQEESDQYIHDNGRIEDGNVAITGPGNLPCKAVIHAVGPVWQGGGRSEEDDLQESILNSLDMASNKSYTSIAVPAISTGLFHYPISKAVHTIVESVKCYFESASTSSLREVHLIDMAEQTTQQFITALVSIYGQQAVTMLTGKTAHPSPLRGNLKWKNMRASRQKSPQLPEKSTNHIQSQGNVRTPAGVQICLVKGELAKQQADVLVNSTSKDLTLKNGAVSASLLKAAGRQMQDEINQNYPGGLANHGEVAITNGGNLQCTKVFHGAMPTWDGGPAKQILVQFIQSCLTNANNSEFSSICIPAMGTGKLNFPKPDVAETMYDTVTKFSLDNPESSIKTVNFIVFPGDAPTVQAFETEHGKRTGQTLSGPSSLRKGRTFKGTSGSQGAVAPAIPKHVVEDDIFPLGSVFLKMTQGDITKESTEAIVNSTNIFLDLSQGAVAKAILKQAGKEILAECKDNVEIMQKEGVAVTRSGKMKCRHIIHLDAGTNDSWKRKIIKCLSKANEMRLTSLAFPALGTGLGKISPAATADDMFRAVMEFQNKLSGYLHVKDVRLVVFQMDMVTGIKTELAKCCLRQEQPQSFFGRVVGAVTGLFGASEESSQDKQSSPKSISLVIISDNDRSIDKAIGKMDEMCKSESEDKMVTDPWRETIKQLSDKQLAAILDSENEQGVKLTVEKERGSIRIQGMPTDVMAAYEKLTKIFKEVQDDLHSYREAEVYAGIVQWYFMGEDESIQGTATLNQPGKTLIKYDPKINKLIEDAFQSKAPCIFTDDTGCKFQLDFNNMTEYPVSDQTDTVEVVRKTLVTGSSGGGFEPPPTWKQMDDSANLEVVPLQPTDQEYQSVLNNLHAQLPAANVNKIERIQNRSLYVQYHAHKAKMERGAATGTTVEKTLWHGTSTETVISINSYGFNRSYCGKNATAFGNGVYFAVHASYSASNTYARPDAQGDKRMYQTKVLVGEFTKGQGGLIAPPVKSGHILFDSVVDSLASPSMYIVFHDTQAYPEYLITFR